MLLLVPLVVCRAEEESRPAPIPEEKDVAKAAVPLAEKKNDNTSLSREELRTLIFLSSLPEEKMDSLKRSIAQLEAMKPEERVELNKRLRMLWEASERDRVRLLREAWGTNWLVRYWESLPPERSVAEKKKFMVLDNEGRRKYVVELRKKMPPPPRQGQPGQGKGSGENSGEMKPPRRPSPEREKMERGAREVGPPPVPMGKNRSED